MLLGTLSKISAKFCERLVGKRGLDLGKCGEKKRLEFSQTWYPKVLGPSEFNGLVKITKFQSYGADIGAG
jgi:hypothetical protein